MPYPSDIAEHEWKRIEHYFQPASRRGRKPTHDKRALVNAVLYVVKSGCQWRMLPSDFPPWQTVYDHFRRWNLNGVWESALAELTRQHRQVTKKASAKLWHR
jgi:putative transposase